MDKYSVFKLSSTCFIDLRSVVSCLVAAVEKESVYELQIVHSNDYKTILTLDSFDHARALVRKIEEAIKCMK